MVVSYELLVSHGKYFLNDYCGRRYDDYLLRAGRNLYPRCGRTVSLMGMYVVARLMTGVFGAKIAAGTLGGVAAIATITLQVSYDVFKLVKWHARGSMLFAAVVLNYGVRVFAGLTAVGYNGAPMVLAPLALAWGCGFGSLFLWAYWSQQGAYYFAIPADPDLVHLLARAKPGPRMVHDLCTAEHPAYARIVPRRIFVALATLSSLFMMRAFPHWDLAATLGLVGYLLLVPIGVAVARRAAACRPPWRHPGFVSAAVTSPVLLTWTALTSAVLVLPFALFSIAVVTYALFTAGGNAPALTSRLVE
jgi:hypothetical protein